VCLTHTCCRSFFNQDAQFDFILLDAPCSSERHLAQRCAPSRPAHAGSSRGTAGASGRSKGGGSGGADDDGLNEGGAALSKGGGSGGAGDNGLNEGGAALDAGQSGGRAVAQAAVQGVAADAAHPARPDTAPAAGLKQRPLTREDWSPSRTGRNATQQLALLMSAARLLQPGGRLVYRLVGRCAHCARACVHVLVYRCAHRACVLVCRYVQRECVCVCVRIGFQVYTLCVVC